MDKKILKRLNINFDSTWKKLTDSEKQEVVAFMQKTLNEFDNFHKDTVEKLGKERKFLDRIVGNMNEQDRQEFDIHLKVAAAIFDRAIEIEGKRQIKVLSSDKPKRLFKDIYETSKYLDSAREGVNSLVDEVVENALVYENSDFASLYISVDSVIKNCERYFDLPSRQNSKVEEFFGAYITKDKGKGKE